MLRVLGFILTSPCGTKRANFGHPNSVCGQAFGLNSGYPRGQGRTNRGQGGPGYGQKSLEAFWGPFSDHFRPGVPVCGVLVANHVWGLGDPLCVVPSLPP